MAPNPSFKRTNMMSRLIDTSIFAGSLIGLLASVVLAVVGVAVAPAPLTGLADSVSKGVMFGLFPVGGAFVLRYNNLTQDTTPREVQKWGYRGCPPWMRYACYGLMIAGLVLFFMPALFESLGSIPKSDGSAFPSTVPGGFGLLAYSAFFGQLYSLKVLANQTFQGSRRQAARP
ncbi:hypothetical protein [Thiobacillus sp.]|uniref:hypothetical protein n=1 Tax=Thiobacillus sp. TaxID=924 RepID=UPI0025CE7CAB|nr:hypothetical protein [Thiobacillus sp.]MBT9539152.1 hypothetical protein [Thiobacillus sp.]